MGAFNTPELLRLLWTTKLYRLYVSLFAISFGMTVLLPVVPTLLTDYFASSIAHEPLYCEDYPPKAAPVGCHDAHWMVVTWQAWTSFASNAVLAFLFSPLVGELSDRYGRKPFILVGQSLSLLPTTVILLYFSDLVPLKWYFCASALSGAVSYFALFMAYVADKLPARHRTAGFGLVLATFSLGFLVGPPTGAFLRPLTTVRVSFLVQLVVVLGTALFIPESLPVNVQLNRAGDSLTEGVPWAWMGMRQFWGIITRNSLFIKLAAIMAVVGMVSEGIQDMLVQYLQLTVGFTTRDQGLLFTLLGVGNLLVQAVMLPLVAPLVGEQRLLLVGLVLYSAEQFLLAFVKEKWMAFVAMGVGSLAGVSWPTISAIKANNASSEMQGAVQGALAGIRALASGVGPVILSQVFRAFTESGSKVGYHPWVVFVIPAGMTIIAAAVAATIDRHAGAGVALSHLEESKFLNNDNMVLGAEDAGGEVKLALEEGGRSDTGGERYVDTATPLLGPGVSSSTGGGRLTKMSGRN